MTDQEDHPQLLKGITWGLIIEALLGAAFFITLSFLV